jgi:ornithine cyclodeaminase/alanine dehydrogenase-like protein (mu-crystallin family)
LTLILSNDDIAKLLTVPDCIAALETAYLELGQGIGVARTRSDSIVNAKGLGEHYSLKSMDGVIPGLGVGAVRINSDLITWPSVNGKIRRKKVPGAPGGRYVGLVLLFSCETGEPLAIFPDGVMQRIRVGATNGLGVKYLAREDARDVGIIGSGWQAGAQLMAVCAIRKIETIRCFSPSKENREAFSKEMSETLGLTVTPVDSVDAAIGNADIVMCATSSLDPILFEAHVKPGMHLSSIKIFEIDPSAVKAADIVVCHNHASKLRFMGVDVQIPEVDGKKNRGAAGAIDFKTLPTLPQLIAGETLSRSSPEQVTCFLNNIGLGYQFAAAGSVVYKKAKEAGMGHDLPTEWFTEDVKP